jgi:alkylation response protein AidB-like acyl-CoA dehydrogenase
MDFSWTAEQLALKRAVIEFARAELNDALVERDRRAELSQENWLKCAQFGIQGSPIPEEYGGSGADILSTLLTMEGLGCGCRDNGLIFALNAQLWSVQLPILTSGTDTQKRTYLPRLCSGELIGAHGMSEPDSGSDAYSLRTVASRQSDGYVLNGTKTFVTNAPIADVALIFATIDRSLGMAGITAFLVDKGTPGFRIGATQDKMGMRTAPMGELSLQDCFVPIDSRLGPEGAGVNIFNSSMEWERSCILAAHIGAMERQLEQCIGYARERCQFDRPIGKFQAVAHRIATMKVRLETARLMLYKVAWLKTVHKPAVMEAAIAKLYLSECFVQSSMDAIAIHGGYGYMTELGVERDLRDAVGGTIYSGTSDIQREIIARFLQL